jgi:hypothetical protein
MDLELSKLTKKELLEIISKMNKNKIIKMLTNKHGGENEKEKNNKAQNNKVQNIEITTENIKFNPYVIIDKNNIMKNNRIYNKITDY